MTGEHAETIARAVADARRLALAAELRATIDESRALAKLHRAVVTLAGRALRADTPPVDTSGRRTPRLGRGLALARGPVVGQVVVSTQLDPLLSLRALADHSGLSVRTLRRYLRLPPDEALPCYRTAGKILVRRSEFDAWIEHYWSRGRPSLKRALQELGLD